MDYLAKRAELQTRNFTIEELLNPQKVIAQVDVDVVTPHLITLMKEGTSKFSLLDMYHGITQKRIPKEQLINELFDGDTNNFNRVMKEISFHNPNVATPLKTWKFLREEFRSSSHYFYVRLHKLIERRSDAIGLNLIMHYYSTPEKTRYEREKMLFEVIDLPLKKIKLRITKTENYLKEGFGEEVVQRIFNERLENELATSLFKTFWDDYQSQNGWSYQKEWMLRPLLRHRKSMIDLLLFEWLCHEKERIENQLKNPGASGVGYEKDFGFVVGKDVKDVKFLDQDLSVRLLKALRMLEKETFGDLHKVTKKDLLKSPTFGKKSLLELDKLFLNYKG